MSDGLAENGLHLNLDEVQDGELDAKPVECPCCGLADAVEQEFDICPRCAWEHVSADETCPWFGAAFSGPNHSDLGHYRAALWEWLLDRDWRPVPPRLSLSQLPDESAAQLEIGLETKIRQQGPRPPINPVALTAAEVELLDKQFEVAPDSDLVLALYWGVGDVLPEKGEEFLYQMVEDRRARDPQPHATWEELQGEIALEWARQGSCLRTRWRRVLVLASLAKVDVIQISTARQALAALRQALDTWAGRESYVEDEALYVELDDLHKEVVEADEGDDALTLWATALHGD